MNTLAVDRSAGQTFGTVAVSSCKNDPVCVCELSQEGDAHLVNASHLTNRENLTSATNTVSNLKLPSDHHTIFGRRILCPSRTRTLLHYQNPLGFNTTMATRQAMQTRDAL